MEYSGTSNDQAQDDTNTANPQDENGQPDFDETDDDAKHQAAKSPAVLGEEDPFSGDATTSESPDIDEELQKVGLRGDDDNGPKSLDIDKELEEET